MVAFKGSKRIFDKVIPFTISNNDTIITSVYGITSYNDIAGVPIILTTFAITTQLTKVNINSLGVKNINNASDIDFTKYKEYKPLTIMYSSELDKFVIKDYTVSSGTQVSEFYDIDGTKIKQLTDYAYAQYLLDPTILNITLNQTDLFNIITKTEIDEIYNSLTNNLNIRIVSEISSSGVNSVEHEFPTSQSWYEDETNDDFKALLELYKLQITSPGTARSDIKQVYFRIIFNTHRNSNYTCDIYVSPLATADDIGTINAVLNTVNGTNV